MSECKHEDDSYYESIIRSDHTDVEAPSDLKGWNEEKEVLECTRECGSDDFCVFHQDRYWEDIWSIESGYTQPIVATARWLRAKFSRIIMLYGESLWRFLLLSLITILGFAVSYITVVDNAVILFSLDSVRKFKICLLQSSF